MKIGYDENSKSYFIGGLNEGEMFYLASILAIYISVRTGREKAMAEECANLLSKRAADSVTLAYEITAGLRAANLMSKR